jgi:hypothetical protein
MVGKMNTHLVRLTMEEEGKVRAAASCRFEQRETDPGCWLIDLIGGKERILPQLASCCSVGEKGKGGVVRWGK